MSTNSRFNAKRIYREDVREWLDRPGQKRIMLDSEMGKLTCYLAQQPDVASLRGCACRLGSTAVTWNTVEFLDAAYHGKPGEMGFFGSRMLDYDYLAWRIFAALADTPGIGGWPWDWEIYLYYLLLLSFRRYEEAGWLGKRLLGAKDQYSSLPGKEKDFGFEPWLTTPLGGLVLRMQTLLDPGFAAGRWSVEDLPDAGPYSGLFAAGDDPEALSRAILDACDYHVHRMEPDPSERYDVAEFSREPYNVLPVEILALRNVRARMGLSTPWPDHPLLRSPFVENLPDELPPCEDRILHDVIAAAGKVLPGFLTDNPLHVIPGVVSLPEKAPLPPPPGGLRREVETSGPFWNRKREIAIRYHVPSAEAGPRCGAELFAQMAREFRDRGRIRGIGIHVTGTPEDMMPVYQAFRQASSANPPVEKWLLEELPRFELDFETPGGDLVRNYEYWTEGGKRMSAEMKPSGE